VDWLQPYPDRLLDQIVSSDSEPDALVIARETIELAYLAAIQ
jgi:RNA polymerase sigma-70 factor (ECF subfamily)